MRKRPIFGVAIVAAVVLLVPALYAAFHSSTEVEQFLSVRRSVATQLDQNAAELPPGFEHVIPPEPSSAGRLDGHIRSVVRSGDTWFGNSYASYDLRISEEVGAKSPKEVIAVLFDHLQEGIAEHGLVSPKTGGPDWLVDNRRAAHSRHWRDPANRFIVTLSVVLDTDSDSAHITRYIHERFE